MANKASLRRIVRVQVGVRKAKSSVPRLSSAVVARAQASNEGLSCSSGILCCLAGTANVGELVVDAVGDDARVESFLLALVAEGVLRLEGEGCSGAAVEPGFELHGWHAEAEVERGVSRCYETTEVTGHCVGDGAEADAW